MRVALVNPQLLGHTTRGTGKYLENLFSELRSFADLEIERIYLSQINKSYDIVHFPYFDPFFLTLPYKKMNKWVITIHDLIPLAHPEHFPPGIKGEIKWQIQKYQAKRANKIITDSNASKEDIKYFLHVADEKISVIYLAADSIFYKKFPQSSFENLRVKFKLPKYFYLYVGDANWNKNIVNILSAIQTSDEEIVLVGKTFSKKSSQNLWDNELQKAEKLMSRTRVTVISEISNEELAQLYQMSVALLFPSRSEGFGLPVIEAMASGCPVITSNRGSLKEIVSNEALIVDPENVTEIVEAIKQIRSVNLRKRLVNAARKRAEKFHWKKTALETKQVYETVLSQ